MTFLSISRNAIEEYAETTCVLLREADGECGIEEYVFLLAGDFAGNGAGFEVGYGEDA